MPLRFLIQKFTNSIYHECALFCLSGDWLLIRLYYFNKETFSKILAFFQSSMSVLQMFEKSGALPNVRLFGVEFCQKTFHSNVHIFPFFTNINTTFSLLNAYFAWYSVANIIPATTNFVVFVLGWKAFFVKALVAIERVCLYNASLKGLSRCFYNFNWPPLPSPWSHFFLFLFTTWRWGNKNA